MSAKKPPSVADERPNLTDAALARLRDQQRARKGVVTAIRVMMRLTNACRRKRSALTWGDKKAILDAVTTAIAPLHDAVMLPPAEPDLFSFGKE